MTVSPETLSIPGKLEQAATRIAFFVVGIAVGAWAPLIPLAKAKLQLDDGQLGLLLLCIGLGSILTMPFSGGLAGKFGCRKVILTAAFVNCLCLPIMGLAPNISGLATALFVFGASVGTIDVVMNIQAVIVEKASAKSMMSGFHGLYSVGGIAGAGGVTGLLAVNLSPMVAASVVVALIALLFGFYGRGLLSYGSEEEAPAFALPKGKVLLMGCLCFIIFLAEGSVLDWSGVFLTSNRNLDEVRAGLGYIAFATTMTLGRLTGDMIVKALGAFKILLLGGLLAAAGFLIAVFIPHWITGIIGFALVGVGAANTVPVIFTAAGNQKSMPTNLAIAGVTTLGYAGILVGPALIGFISRATSLTISLSVVAGMLLLVSLCAKRVTES